MSKHMFLNSKPRNGSHDIAMHSEEDLFEIYDYAFKNSHFGHV